MKLFYGASETGSVKEAVKNLSNPKSIILLSNTGHFEENVAELEELYPSVPSIGCVAMAYGQQVTEKGVAVAAFLDNVAVAAGVLEEVSSMPVKYISRLEKDIAAVKPSGNNTAMIDFCTGNDAAALSSVSYLLKKHHIELMGGTGDAGKLSCNGKVYEDAMVYLLVKNGGGKVKTYKENLYAPRTDLHLVASKTDKVKYYVGELDGRPAKQVYMELTDAKEKDFSRRTFRNPLGKMVGDDICIISLKEVSGNGFCCYRQVNDSDILTVLELQDISEVVGNTIRKIQSDFRHISSVFSVNCLFRYLLMNEEKMLGDYLEQMSVLGKHCGFVGYGEHFNGQFINQTMTCVVFE